MKTKIIITLIVICLMGVIRPEIFVKAENEIKYDNVQAFMSSQGYTDFVEQDGYTYLITIYGYYYKVYEVKNENAFFGAIDETSIVYLIGDRSSKVLVYYYYAPEKAAQMANYALQKTEYTNNRTTYFPEYGANWGTTSWTWSEKFDSVIWNDVDIYKVTENRSTSYTYIPDYTVVFKESTIKVSEEINNNILDTTLKLQNITTTGFMYNGISYDWGSMQEFIVDNDCEDYAVFFDDYNNKIDFIWSFSDIFMQGNLVKSGLRYFKYYTEFITTPNNSSVLPYAIISYQIDDYGTLTCLNDLKTNQATENHQFEYAWTKTEYAPHLDEFETFSTYIDYVLSNNLIASNCYIYGSNGASLASPKELDNSILQFEVIPETEFGVLRQYLYDRLPIIGTVEVFIVKFKYVLNVMKDTNKAPEIIMNVNDYYGFTGEINVLDLEWYEPYREYVKAIISALLVVSFILWVYRKGLPDAIGGI